MSITDEQKQHLMSLITTEGDAIELYFALAHRFGWQGTFFTRDDVESAWHEMGFSDNESQTVTMTDDVWDKITSDWVWHSGLTERLTELGWEMLNALIAEIYTEQEDQS